MADEHELTAPVETDEAKAPVIVKEPAKPVAPRRLTVSDAANKSVKAAKPAKQARKKIAQARPSSSTAPASAPQTQDAASSDALNAANSTATASPILGDTFSALMQLEEENERLRKALAEKLRLENAELRRKLERN